MSMDVPPRPERPKIHARDLIDQLPEPDPALVRPPAAPDKIPSQHHPSQHHGRGKARRSWPQRILLLLLVVAALISASAAALGSYLTHKLDQITYIDVELSAPPPPGDPRNLLIVGSDSRDALAAADNPSVDTSAFVGDDSVGSGQRSDSIIVVRVDPAATAVDVLSIPRDLWLPISGTDAEQRINTAYAGGPQRLVDTIEEQFDLPIHHYVEIDFVGFADLVSAVGGVPMWFDTAVRDTHSGLYVESAGCHRLDAQSALAYARSRHFQYQDDNGRWQTDGTGDLGRITRQQVFLRRATDQVGRLGITDALTLNRLLDVGINNVTLSTGLGLSQLRDLAQRFANFDSDAMRTHALPTYSFRTSGGASVEGLVEADAQPMLNVFRGLPPDSITPVEVDDVTVLNGTGIEGQAALVADALEQVGFGVTETGNVERDQASPDSALGRTTVRYGADAERRADLVERHLTAGADLVLDRALDPEAVVIEIGTDFTTIGRNARPSVRFPPSTGTPTDTTPTSEVGSEAGGGLESSEPIGVAPDPSKRCG